MDTEALLPTTAPPHLLHSLPEHSPVSSFSPPPSPVSSFSPPPSPCPSPASSYQERLILGPHHAPPPPPPPPPPTPHSCHRVSADDTLRDLDLPSCSSSTTPSLASNEENPPSLFDFLGSHTNLHRSRTAPAMAPLNAAANHRNPPPPPRRSTIVLHAFLFLLPYLALGVTFYAAASANFTSSAEPTHPVADALYFCIVTSAQSATGTSPRPPPPPSSSPSRRERPQRQQVATSQERDRVPLVFLPVIKRFWFSELHTSVLTEEVLLKVISSSVNF